MQNININNVRALKLDIRRDEYFDSMLYKGDVLYSTVEGYDEWLAADIDINSGEIDEGLMIAGVKKYPQVRYYSHNVWANAVNDDIKLDNIGFTGVDNGFIKYQKDQISNKEFLELYTGTTYTTNSKRFFMTPISGNTMYYEYPFEIKDNYFSLKGGFLQGFFKLDGHKYQTLPDKIDDGWTLSFKLRRRDDYESTNKVLNYTHPENQGIFFYIGTRAENKFWKYYKYNSGITEEYKTEEYSEEYIEDEEHVPNCDYVVESEQTGVCDRLPIDEEYWEKDIDITTDDFNTKEGIKSDTDRYYEIETDNKFITFHRGEGGYTVDTWDDSITTVLTGQTRPNLNLFPLMNRTETGYTVEDYEQLLEENDEYRFNILNDIKNNAFALKINDDGSIGYRYGVLDCDKESHYNVIEEYSFPNTIVDNEWADVVVCFKPNAGSKCGNSNRIMKIYFYVNGKLVFISKEVPVLEFKRLNEASQKQEGVGFNLSLGGGTQGLAEVVYPDYYQKNKYMFPLEKDFAGTFIGDIERFKFYNCVVDFSTIRKINLE